MTKEMSADKRADVLTDALLYYGEKLRKKFGNLKFMQLKFYSEWFS
jgi:hypothetical protein